MTEKKKRFSFDDTEPVETIKSEQEKKLVQKPVESRFEFDDKEKTFDDEDTTIIIDGGNNGDGEMPKQKKKRRLKKWHIALIALVSIAIVFVIYVFMATQSDGPVYGDRCASMISLDNSKFAEIETKIKEDPTITDIKIEAECRILKMTITFADNTPAATAEELANKALHTFDDSIGQPKEDGAVFSQLFGKANGRGQFNVEFYLKSNGDTDFPIFGTKHPSSDTISFTGANPANQETTDKVLAPEEVAQ